MSLLQVLLRAGAVYPGGIVQERQILVVQIWVLLHIINIDWICTLIPMSLLHDNPYPMWQQMWICYNILEWNLNVVKGVQKQSKNDAVHTITQAQCKRQALALPIQGAWVIWKAKTQKKQQEPAINQNTLPEKTWLKWFLMPD